VPELASMSDRHDISALPEPLLSEISDDELRVGMPEEPPTAFQLVWVPSLTRRTVDEVVDRAKHALQPRIFVSYRKSSAEARDALRAAGISFAGDDGRVFVRAPGLFVERDGRTAPRRANEWDLGVEDDTAVRNPFAKRSSRIPRWFLLHHEESFSLSELARSVDLNPAAVSRVVRALEEAALVGEATSDAVGRRRNVRLERPRDLLDAWLPQWQRRRVRQQIWDVGARDIDETLIRLREAVEDQPYGWAIGGLAGAAMVRRAVEPVDVVVWASDEEAATLAKVLRPERARGGPGVVRVAVAPDPWTLGLARRIDGLPVVDPVGLWLDCASEGERALEAAEALADIAGWS
jgi:DNA-binding MarR family transcriptional regulator